MKKNLFLSILSIAVLSISCKDDPEPAPEPPSTEYVFIANEGLFPSGIGTLSQYSPSNKIIEHNLFQKANVYNAGAVVNSVLVDGDRMFIVVSADAVVYAINTVTHVVEAKFENLGSPRYVVKVATDKYYISDWGIQGVHVVNMKSKRISKTLPSGFGPEQMLLHDGKVFIANAGGIDNGARKNDSTVTIYDANVDTVMAILRVGRNPNSLKVDANDQVWVLSGGQEDTDIPSNSIPGDLRIINPDSLEVTDSIIFVDNIVRAEQLAINQAGDELYFMDNYESANIRLHYVIDTVDKERIYIAGTFNALGTDLVQDELYTADKKTEVVPGKIYRYDTDASLIQGFDAGLKPTAFAFKTK